MNNTEPLNKTAKMEMRELSFYLQGLADSSSGNPTKEARLKNAAKYLATCSLHVCGQGFFGCHGGENCSSDHK